jgi:hypothetical protein
MHDGGVLREGAAALARIEADLEVAALPPAARDGSRPARYGKPEQFGAGLNSDTVAEGEALDNRHSVTHQEFSMSVSQSA